MLLVLHAYLICISISLFFLVFSFVKFASIIYVYICFYLLSVIKIYIFCIYIDFLNILNFFLVKFYIVLAQFS